MPLFAPLLPDNSCERLTARMCATWLVVTPPDRVPGYVMFERSHRSHSLHVRLSILTSIPVLDNTRPTYLSSSKSRSHLVRSSEETLCGLPSITWTLQAQIYA